jgi:outer membrane protein insertion porin family
MSFNDIVKKTSRTRFIVVFVLFLVCPTGIEGLTDEKDPFVEWKIKEILFEGNSFYPDDVLRDLMKHGEGDDFQQWQLDEDLEAIENFYRRNGFIGYHVEDIEKDADVRKGLITIKVLLIEGERIVFRRATFEGNTLISDGELLNRLDLEEGDPYHSVKVDRFLQGMTEYYSERGNIRLNASSQTRLSARGDSVDVLIIFDEGPRVFVGEVNVSGTDKVSEGLVRKGSRLRRGNLVTLKRLQESQQSIYQTNLFKNVALTLQDTVNPDTMDVLVTVRESDFKTFGFGGGYGSVDGIKAIIEWNQYHIFSRAEAVRTKSEITYQPFELSRIEFSNAYATAFTQPFFMNTLIWAQWSLSYKISDYLTYNQEVTSFKGHFSRTFGFQKRLSLLMDFNSTKIFDVDPVEASIDVRENEGRQNTNSLTTTFVLDKRKDLFYPEEKDFLTLESTLAGGPLFGEVNFIRFFADYARYFLVSERYLRPVIAARLKFGTVMGLHSRDLVLPGEQFVIGGANTLRGYKEQSIGPLGDEGDPNTHSGNYIILLNLEARFAIWRKLGGVLFFDSGNVYDDDFNPRSPFFLTSFGGGIRYRSPIGPIRLEGALRIDRNLSFLSGVGRVHFSVGQAF